MPGRKVHVDLKEESVLSSFSRIRDSFVGGGYIYDAA